MNKEYYAEVKALREQGKTYQEIADQLGNTRRYVQDYCGRHKELQYSEEERNNVERVAWNKDQSFADFGKNVERRYGGMFELVSICETNDKSERLITIRCKTCGVEKTVSSITLRSKHIGRCLICKPQGRPGRKASKLLKVEKGMKKLHTKLVKEKEQTKKKLKENQISLGVCKCGQALLLSNQKVCDECKRKTLRTREMRKETKRRMRAQTADEFDKTITLDGLIIKDHNICYLCGEQCDRNDYQIINGNFVVGAKYPTIEHVIALCNGGTHTWNNVKLACHGCNSKKGKKLLVG
jgi:5-methylcytosine-specific restriction endonuclease McrA